MDWRDRTRRLVGEAALAKLAAARVVVFGLGAVGSYAVEGLVRAGVGHFRLVDFDVFKLTNLNRQLYALHSTLGKAKAEVAAERVLDVNPLAEVEPRVAFAHCDTLADLLAGKPDLAIDAVDSLNPKVEIIAAAAALGIPVFSAMGAATRLDAACIRFGPLFSASGCPLARLVRKRLRRRSVTGDLYCVYSCEQRNVAAVSAPDDEDTPLEEGEYRRGRARSILGSLSGITGLFGLRLAHEAVLRLAGIAVGGDHEQLSDGA